MRAIPAVLLLLVVSACGGGDDGDDADRTPTPTPTGSADVEGPPTSAPTQTASVDEPEPPGTRIVVRGSDFGPMLFDERGQAIYLFDVETTDEPRCYRECAVAWPPVLTEGSPVAGKGVRPALLGTTQRRDGSTQVTYAGHPLYFYAHEAPGEVECHDVFLNGGYWYVVQPDGDRAP